MRSIDINSIVNNKFILSPSNYKKIEIKSEKKISLSDLIDKKEKGTEVGSANYVEKSKYKFIRTSALSNDCFSIYEDHNSILSINPNVFVDYHLKKNDILICKDSNVGEVVLLERNYPNYMFSSGINRIHIKNNPLYVFAIMKNKIFREQLMSFIPKGATLRHAKDNYLKCIIPFPNDEEIVEYITSLVKIIQNKEMEIKKRNHAIENIISNEIINNQKENKFEYSYPTISQLEKNNRLDTGSYTEEFSKIDFFIKNYINGYYYINEKNIKGGNTPKKRFISKDLNLKYIWITPSYINDNGTLDLSNRINCQKNNINRNCLLIINRTSKGGIGEYVGVSTYYDFDKFGKAQHNQGIYRVTSKSNEELIALTCLLNSSLYRKYCANISMGSKMKELKLNNILAIPFPKLPDKIVRELNKLYYNSPRKEKILKENFEQANFNWDKDAGLINLFNSAENSKKILNNIIEQIYLNEDIVLDYTIL